MVKDVDAIDISGFVKKADYDSKINETKCEIPSNTGLATTAALTDVKNKTPDASDLFSKNTDYDAKIGDKKGKCFNISNYNNIYKQNT